MTGYGRGQATLDERRLVVEARAVNHRFLDLKLRLPWSDPAIEALVGGLVRAKLERGAVTVSVSEEGRGAGGGVRADIEMARAYAAALERIAQAVGTVEPPSLALIAGLPGVLAGAAEAPDPERLGAALKPAVEQALAALVATREREGLALKADLEARIARLAEIAGAVGKLAAEAPLAEQKRLEERLQRLLAGAAVDPARLAQEVAIIADRLDVTEELTRLTAHLTELGRLLAQPGATGRRFEFLLQEVHREVNTVGSKSQSAEAARLVVEAKAELERMREQVQNIE